MAETHADTSIGDAWLAALANGALVDSSARRSRDDDPLDGFSPGPVSRSRLPVEEIVVEPGRLSGSVQSGRYSTSLEIEILDESAWSNILDSVMLHPRSVAILLSGEVPPRLHSQLLPAPRQLAASCTCEAPTLCRHVKAFCHQVAPLLESDPFALLVWRGRSRAEFLAKLRVRRSERQGIEATNDETSNWPRGQDPGMTAAAAYRRTRGPTSISEKTERSQQAEDASLPSMPPPARAQSTFRLASPPPSDSGVDEAELADLVVDGAQRALAMLTGEADSSLLLTPGADVARRAIKGDVEAIAQSTNLPVEELTAAAAAFRHGGPAGIAATRQRWDPPPRSLQPGLEALRLLNKSPSTSTTSPSSTATPKVVPRANTVSRGTVQLRLDPDGLWWRFEADEQGWVLVAPPALDPTDLI